MSVTLSRKLTHRCHGIRILRSGAIAAKQSSPPMAISFGKTWKSSHIDGDGYLIMFDAHRIALRLPKATKTNPGTRGMEMGVGRSTNLGRGVAVWACRGVGGP
ncbi:hypothetical protein DVH24_002899 [Malus domestica]|uniref:Uncharacterized protein n=1 Tax=Malus domestica TaxID=3750 RepID=A0A498K5M5_MALDO|nr:hypothetical protein DVH24_002899 [Malus domestica]